MRLATTQSGFTLVETMVCVAIIIILFAIGSVSLGQPQNNTATLSAVDTLVNDIKSQQIASMAGVIGSTTTQQNTGIFVQSNQYTLFTGSTYSAGDSYNYVYTPPSGVTFSTTLPSGTVIFSKGAGDISGFVAGSNTITVTTGTQSKVITINRFGVVTVT